MKRTYDTMCLLQCEPPSPAPRNWDCEAPLASNTDSGSREVDGKGWGLLRMFYMIYSDINGVTVETSRVHTTHDTGPV